MSFNAIFENKALDFFFSNLLYCVCQYYIKSFDEYVKGRLLATT